MFVIGSGTPAPSGSAHDIFVFVQHLSRGHMSPFFHFDGLTTHIYTLFIMYFQESQVELSKL